MKKKILILFAIALLSAEFFREEIQLKLKERVAKQRIDEYQRLNGLKNKAR